MKPWLPPRVPSGDGSRPGVGSRRRALGAAVLGLLLVLVVIELALRLAGAVHTYQLDASNRRSLARGGTIRVVCVGDSITAGGNDDSYPKQMERWLNRQGLGRTFAVINRGVMGADTSVILAQLDQNLATYKPQVFVAMMGANDGGGAIPMDDIPVAEQVGGLYHFKTYKLLRLLIYLAMSKEDSSARQESEAPRRAEDGKGVAGSAEAPDELIGPPHMEAYYRLLNSARSVKWQGDEARATKMFERAVGMRPGYHLAYSELGVLNLERGLTLHTAGDKERARPFLQTAQRYFEQAVERAPDSLTAVVELGNIHEISGRYDRAEQVLRRGLESLGRESILREAFGRFLMNRQRYREAYEHLSVAAELRPKEAAVYVSMAFCKAQLGEKEKYNQLLGKALSVLPRGQAALYTMPFFRLARNYDRLGRRADVVRVLNDGIRRFPGDRMLLDRLAGYYRIWGQKKKAGARRLAARRVGRDYYREMTRRNYERLKQELVRHKIPLVAVQYPRRRLSLLRRLLSSTDGVTFVSNERTIEEAVERRGYSAVFSDHCYGDSGHGTVFGNGLMAENVGLGVLRALGMAVPRP